jgi:hypothetical protein
MQLIQVKLEDGSQGKSRHFQRKVNRPYANVPSTGDAMDYGEGLHRMVRRIHDVIYLSSGEVIVRSTSGEVNHDRERQVQALRDLGFIETKTG